MSEEVERFLVAEAVVYQGSADCSAKPTGVPPLPAGLRVRAKPDPKCPDHTYIRWDPPGWQLNEPWAYVETRLLGDPPKPAWSKAASTGTVYADQVGEKPFPALPLDRTDWQSPLLLSEGEPLEMLAPRVVRTATGRVGMVDPRRLLPAQPKESGWNLGLLTRFHTGRAHWEKGHDVRPLPSSDTLAKATVGDVFWFELNPTWIVERRYTAEWFDPVGVTLTHTCGATPKVDEPCGTYTLDFSPLGAWWPDQTTEVLATWDGKSLTVRVLEPWEHGLAVTPSWAE